MIVIFSYGLELSAEVLIIKVGLSKAGRHHREIAAGDQGALPKLSSPFLQT